MLTMLRNLIKSCLKLYLKLWIWILVEVFLLVKASLFPPDAKANPDEGIEARSKPLTQESQLGGFNFWDVPTDWDFWAAVNSHNRRRHASLPTTLRR